MSPIRTIVLEIVCLATVALAQKTSCPYDRAVDFPKFRSYKWVTIQGATPPNQITAQNITNPINATLAQKGLLLVSDGDADVPVGYQASVAQQQQLNWYNDGGGWGWGGGFGQATTAKRHREVAKSLPAKGDKMSLPCSDILSVPSVSTI